MNFITSPDFILALAKVTALLLVIFALAPLLKDPTHRARLWTLTFLVLPFLFASSFFTPVLQLIPHRVAEEPSEISASPTGFDIGVTGIDINTNESLIPEYLQPDSSPPIPTHPWQPEPNAIVITEVEAQTEASPGPTSAPPVPWAFLILFVGTILSLLPFLISSLKVLFLKRTEAQDPPHSLWREIHQSGKKTPPLSFTPSPAAPFTCGIIRPRVLLPDDSPVWPLRRLHSTLLHEAAHLRRRDPLVRFLATVVRAAFWFHPLIWLAHRKLVAAQEHACDQFALTHGISPDDYAEDLLASATHSHLSPSEALSMAKWSQLGNRIRHILEKPKPSSMTTITLTTLLALIATLAFTSIGFSQNELPSQSVKPITEKTTGQKLHAKVTHRTPATLTINRGRQHGIKTQQPVLSPEGLVGRIISTTNQTSKVLLLTDETSQVSAKVENTAEVGILSGQPNQPDKMPKLRLRFLSSNANLKPGALVYTDGRSKLYPADLLLGSVESFTSGPIYGEAIVKPAINFTTLGSVFVDLSETSPVDESAKKQHPRGSLFDRKNKPLATNGADGLRTYPAGKSTAHLIGYVGKVRAGEPAIYEGKSGLEKAYDLPLSQHQNVKLTLDASLQEHCYKLLESQKHPGVIIVQDPNSGEILAMSSYPSFDPNLFIPFISPKDYHRLREEKQAPLYYRAVQGRFAPGSIVKPLVALAGEYAGLNNPEIHCRGFMTFGKEGKIRISDWKKDRDELLRIPGALKTSCNTYFMELAHLTGAKGLTETGKLFHLNEHLLPEFPRARSTWMTWPKGTNPTRINLALTSLGQGHLLLSPLEINAVTSALATGTWHQPHLLPRQKTTLPSVNLIGRGEITDQSLQHIRQGLFLAVNEKGGTAGRAGLPQVKVAGKTGTAQLGQRGDGPTHNSWFTGYAPFEKPKYAVTVMLEGPNSGGQFAAPLASTIFKLLLGKD